MSAAVGSQRESHVRVKPVTREFPEVDEVSLQHSARVVGRISKMSSANAGGWIPFSKYMDLAMFAPGLGYYSAGAAKIGAAGDFTTAPEMSTLFGATLAKQVAQC